MTITNGLLTRDEALSWVGQNATRPTGELDDSVNAASRLIEELCGRTFYQQTAQARVFDAECSRELDFGPFNDVVSVTTLKTDQDGDGVFETTISSTNYQLGPANATVRGWPYTEIRLLNGAYFPLSVGSGRTHLVEVTGTFGWPSVPDAVKAAARLVLAELVKLQDAPLGVAGATDFGVAYVRSNLPPRVLDLLGPYKHGLSFGIA